MIQISSTELDGLGPVTAVRSAAGLRCLLLRPETDVAARARRQLGGETPVRTDPAEEPAFRQLAEYLAGARTTFELPYDLVGTPFQQRVWRALLEIPAGETRSYAEIAAAIGRPTAVRAVGAAIGANPLCIVVPCHRVVGSDGSLTGFAYGLAVKKKLLQLEGSPAGGSLVGRQSNRR